jgi:hypothetical protein
MLFRTIDADEVSLRSLFYFAMLGVTDLATLPTGGLGLFDGVPSPGMNFLKF